jgi:hypothetical protein
VFYDAPPTRAPILLSLPHQDFIRRLLYALSLFCWDPNLAGPCFSVAVGSRLDTLGGSDNQVTSVNPAHYGSWTILSEYTYGQGNQFWVQSGLPAFNDLRVYGWSDMASSIEVR